MKKIVLGFTSIITILLSTITTTSYAESGHTIQLLPVDVPNYIANFKAQQQKLTLTYQKKSYPIRLATILDEGLLVSFQSGIALIGFDFDKQQPRSEIMIFEGKFNLNELSEEMLDNANQIWESKDISITERGDQIIYKGRITNQDGTQSQVNVSVNESLISGGSSRIKVEGNKAILKGELGTSTYIQIRKLITDYPQVDTIVIAEVNGSINDEINVHSGYLIREAGLNTVIPMGGYAYSGGVDLLLSGVKRTVANNAEVGVHSWCCVDEKTAAELPKNHPAHQSLLDYSAKMLGANKGKAFYFYTLEAAPFDGVHIMPRDELEAYDVVTQ